LDSVFFKFLFFQMLGLKMGYGIVSHIYVYIGHDYFACFWIFFV